MKLTVACCDSGMLIEHFGSAALRLNVFFVVITMNVMKLSIAFGIVAALFSACSIETECRLSSQKCENDEADIGLLSVCTDGFWNPELADRCPKNASCKAVLQEDEEPSCGVCHNGQTQCQDDVASTCVGGVWSEFVECPLGCNTTHKHCERAE